ncbi:MAG TPA: efflux RND transporter periplasmic adaptor subunit [Candidatus Angelobacter sp.]|jgi:multidrug efflux pump subunit AcrA (membrane-fusion protein)|nr:efflux RND transporter periplasmic adaptor subunit [Candidatus Angelobacter sp.]
MTLIRRNSIFIVLPVAILGLAAIIPLNGCKGAEKAEPTVVSVQAEAAKQEDISRMINTEAVIFPLYQAAITPKLSAPVRKFYVVRGQQVRQGQLLAELENRDLAAAELDNKGAYEQAQAAYTTNVGATLPEDTRKAEADVENAQKALDAAQKLYSSREVLFQQGALPRKDLDTAGVALTQARTQFDIAKKHLDALNAIGKAQALKAASGQLTSAKGKYLGSQAQLSYSEIRSPINGVVTDRPLYPGEMASTSAPFMTVMDISSIIAKAHVPQSDAMLLRKGDKATIEVPGLEKMPGTVTLVSPALDPNSTTVEVWVQVSNPKQQLRPGATGQISITAQTVHDALIIPASALLNASGDQAQVLVIGSDGMAKSRDVKTGIKNSEDVQIISGLKAGEQVVTEGAYGLKENTKVKVEKPGPEAEGGEAKDKDKDKDNDKEKDAGKDKGKDASKDKEKD